MDLSRLNKKVTFRYEKEIKLIIIMMILRYWMTYLYDLTCIIESRFWTDVADVVIHHVIILPPFIVYKKTGLHKEVINFKNKSQYIYGILATLIFFGACQIVFGLEFEKDGYVMTPDGTLWLFIYFLFVVAISEEFFFRVYLLEELAVIFGRFKWLAPIVSGVFFGMIHWINMGLDSVYMNIIIGIALGYAKLYIKNCTFISCVMAHGLYDFIITVTGW